MKYKRLLSTLLLSAALSLPASAYTVAPAAEAPQWQVDWSYNQERPDWQEPDAGAFENWTVMLVKIEEALLPYVSEDDLLAIFVGGELRGLASPSVDVSTDEVDASQFLLKVYGNENLGDELDLIMQYYNARAEQLFTLSETMTIDDDVLYGFDEDFIPPFTQGSPKYPMMTTINVAPTIASAGITPTEGDMAAIFVGDECRGVATMTDGQWSAVDVYQHEAGEAVVLKYYDAAGDRFVIFEGNFTGDVNGDGVADVADISAAITAMANTGAGSETDRSADVNGDGVADVADVASIISIMAVK